MHIINWMLWQLFSYGLVTWLAFLLIAYSAARYGGWRLVPVGHLVVAAIILFLDMRWIRAEMSRPGWDGTPDMDMVFHFGVLMRILLVNAILLLVTAIGLWRRRRLRPAGCGV